MILFFYGLLFSVLFTQNTSPFISQRPTSVIYQNIDSGQTVDLGIQIGCQPSRDTHRVILSFYVIANDKYIVQIYYPLLDTEYHLKSVTMTEDKANFIINVEIPANSIKSFYFKGKRTFGKYVITNLI